MSAPATVVDRIPFALTEISREAREAAGRVLASGWVTTGPEVAEFEREFAAWVGAEHAVAVSSCTAAIELALRSMRLPPGSKVLTSTMTFCGAVHAIVHAGLRPVLADVDPITLMPDARTTAAAARRAGGVDAMVVLHFAGFPAAVDQLAEAAGLPTHRVIEESDGRDAEGGHASEVARDRPTGLAGAHHQAAPATIAGGRVTVEGRAGKPLGRCAHGMDLSGARRSRAPTNGPRCRSDSSWQIRSTSVSDKDG